MYLRVYNREKDEKFEQNMELVTKSVHFAVIKDGNEELLNYNTGVLFLNEKYKTYINPLIFRVGNEINIVSEIGDSKGNPDEDFTGKYALVKTIDFYNFSEPEYVNKEEYVNISDRIEITEEEYRILQLRYGNTVRKENRLYKGFQIDDYADPIVRFNQDNGKYYFMATTGGDGNKTLTIREADSVNELSDAKAKPIRGENGYSFELGVNNDDKKLLLWAPELHKIGDYWYLLFASGCEEWYGQNAYIMKNRTGDLMDEFAWEDAKLVMQKDGVTELYKKGITLDMTYLEDGDKHYLIWAGRKTQMRGADETGSSNLYIATIDKENPFVLTSDIFEIAKPEYGFEIRTTEVLEGPFAIKKFGKIYLSYSASGVDESYCVGFLIAKEGSDLLDKKNWTKLASPLLTTEIGGELGPGHCSFTIDEFGNEIFIYHYFRNSYATRSARARELVFSELLLPILNA